MKIAQIGYGSMGRAIVELAQNRRHQVTNILRRNDAISAENLKHADIAIECTLPDSVMDNIRQLAALKQDMLIVTTGWNEYLPEVEKLVKENGIRCLYSSNFSIGVNIYFRIIDHASKWINKFEEYDIRGTEVHHRNKVDSPSGTAKTITDILLKNIDRKTSVVEETLHRRIEDSELHFTSTRAGLNNFYHAVSFDSAVDSIEISHRAISRNGYASGILQSGEWLLTQEPGLYTMDDFLDAVIGL